MTGTAAIERPAPDNAGESTALGDGGDIDKVVGGENIRLQRIANLERRIFLGAEFLDLLRRRILQTGLGHVAAGGLRRVLGLAGAETELDGAVAVISLGPERQHGAGTCFDDGDGDENARVGVNLGHAQLLSNNALHSRLPPVRS